VDSRKKSYNLIITGVGGQGNVLSSQLIGQALVSKGYFTTIGETYGASQRGGSVMSHIRISSEKQLSPFPVWQPGNSRDRQYPPDLSCGCYLW
jgi:Pyruvate/2-oxoacid:ferredoxin oxidoreductase gamma subunit